MVTRLNAPARRVRGETLRTRPRIFFASTTGCAMASSEIENGVEPAVDTRERRDFANRQQRAVDIRTGARTGVMTDGQPLMAMPKMTSALIT